MLSVYRNQFCLIKKTNGRSFNKTIEMLKLNFRVVDNVITDTHVKSFNKSENKPKTVQFLLNNL